MPADSEHPLLAWYAAHRDEVPAAPFALRPGSEVLDREAYLASLDEQAAEGVNGARFPTLVAELETLRTLVGPESDRG